MIPIYDVETASRTILQRELTGESRYPPSLIERVEQVFGNGATPESGVRRILAEVRAGGDAALREWSERLDRDASGKFRIGQDQLATARDLLSADLIDSLELAAGRIRQFHERQPLPEWSTSELGGRLGQRVTPIERVGVYVPGGTAPLPSSLLMSVIPAQVAGVQEIVVCTPPDPHPSILAAASICGLDAIYQLGGAQAIAAMAFGTESVPKVDKIVGAGNLFVTLAKQQVFGIVGLDGLAGPTETLVIADYTAKPVWVAADLLAQAEHDTLAAAILLTTDETLAEQVQAEVRRQARDRSRYQIIKESLSHQSGIVMTPDLETAAELSNQYAPEHLCLAVEEPKALAELITNAGGIFFGERSFEVLGDYVAGPSHVMPTGGSARFSSPLNVLDFIKLTSIIDLDDRTSSRLSPAAATIARVESLTAHAAAADLRAEQKIGAAGANG